MQLFHDELRNNSGNLITSGYAIYGPAIVIKIDFEEAAIKLNISNLRLRLGVRCFFLKQKKKKKKQLCICYIDHVWFIWCCICKSSLDSLIKMNFDATDSCAGLCLNSPPARWQAANPPLSYQLLLESQLSFHQAGPVDGNELGIFRAILIWAVVHNAEELVFPNRWYIYPDRSDLCVFYFKALESFKWNLLSGCSNC